VVGRGLLITFEGIDGAGKSTQAQALAEALGARGLPVVTTYEPGATKLGATLRPILLAGDLPLGTEAELLLFLADRADHVQQIIEPALAAGQIVLCDRFIDSTLAYQGYGKQAELDRLVRWNTDCSGGLIPDLTLLLDCPVGEGARRRQRATDRYQRRNGNYHERVRQGFLTLAAAEPERIHVINSAVDLAELTATVTNTVIAWLSARGQPGRDGHGDA